MNLKDIIAYEKSYCTNFPTDLDESKANIALDKWKLSGLGIIEENRTEESLNRSVIESLKLLRYGVMNSNVINEIDIETSIDRTMNERIEYGGMIKDDNIIVRFTGEKGVIENYNYDNDEINYHTHPYQVNKWRFAPPSESDLISLMQTSLEKGILLKSVVAASEGIYYYSLSDELFTQLNTNRDSIDYEHLRSIIQDLKLLLGYAKSISVNKRRKTSRAAEDRSGPDTSGPDISRVLFGGAAILPESPKSPIFNTSESSKFTIIEGKITLDKYLRIIRLMGFIMELIPYTTYQVTYTM